MPTLPDQGSLNRISGAGSRMARYSAGQDGVEIKAAGAPIASGLVASPFIFKRRPGQSDIFDPVYLETYE